ncbi:MAG: CdaR family protein [Nitrospiraceae bacterium]|nr:CdaR family protein [Nitrospiraceae bacterium]
MDVKRILFENWHIKLASLLLAVTLWFYVTAKGKTEITVTAPLELRNVPQGLAVVGDVVASVEVRLQGQERALRDLSGSRKVIGSVDLSGAREGGNRIGISPDDIRRPAGVAVAHLAPSEIDVKLEHLVRKTLRLQPVVQGKPAPGYRLSGVTIKPSRITLEGPAGVVSSFAGIQTLPIDISGKTGTFTIEPRIDYQGKAVRIIEQEILATIAIQKERP